MLKMKIDKATFDTLSDTVKEQYKPNADSTEYALEVDGLPQPEDTAELRRANERNKIAAKDEKKRADDLQAQLDAKEENNSKRRGDIDSLEKSYKDKIAKTEKDAADLRTADRAIIRGLLIDSEAAQIAQISTVPTVLLPHVLKRLDVDFDAEKPTLRVLDAAGKPTALTVAELKKEFVDNKEFAPIIRVSNASGGGAAGNQGGGATKAFKDMGDVERREFAAKDPAGFKRETDAAKAAAKTH